MADLFKNLTTEDFQRYARIVLQWIASFLVTRGMIKADASWLEPAIGVAVAMASLAWTIYSSRLQGRIIELAKSPGVQQVLVTDTAMANSIPSDKVTTQGVAGASKPVQGTYKNWS